MDTSRRRYNKHAPGDRHGNLTLIKRLPGGQKWECVCDCGETVITQIATTQTMCSKCSRKIAGEKMIVHGFNRKGNVQRLYGIWTGMKSRCNNPKVKCYMDYGGRGITVCREWAESFINFKDWALTNGYDDSLTIDRINNSGNYEPGNCRWIRQSEQGKNTRRTHFVDIDGKTLCVMDWCRELGIKKTNAYCNAKEQGLTVEEYLTKRYMAKRGIAL